MKEEENVGQESKRTAAPCRNRPQNHFHSIPPLRRSVFSPQRQQQQHEAGKAEQKGGGERENEREDEREDEREKEREKEREEEREEARERRNNEDLTTLEVE